MLQFHSCVFSGELPVDPSGVIVSSVGPCSCFSAHLLHAWDSVRQAIFVEDAEFYFGHIQPASMPWRIVDLKTVPDTFRFFGRKGLVQRRGTVGVEVVHHQHHLFRVPEVLIDQAAYLLGPVLACAPFGDFDSAPAEKRGDKHEKIACSVPDVFGIETFRFARFGTHGWTYLPDELLRAFVHAD